jgi:hypothetical protein
MGQPAGRFDHRIERYTVILGEHFDDQSLLGARTRRAINRTPFRRCGNAGLLGGGAIRFRRIVFDSDRITAGARNDEADIPSIFFAPDRHPRL